MKSRHRTKAQQQRKEAIHAGQCLACMQLAAETGRKFCCGYTQEHHTAGKTKPGAHDKTVSLGAWHHQGIAHTGWTLHSMRTEYGPSLAEGSKPFHARFGSHKELLERQDRILAALPAPMFQPA